jgi:glyoxylase-like metal-dependent hydrolase (beta-lactamase superfamily II)
MSESKQEKTTPQPGPKLVQSAERLPGQEILDSQKISLLRANNPSVFTLSGTNTWIIGQEKVFVIDPGPSEERHLKAIIREIDKRGKLSAILLTHDHPDHSEAIGELLAQRPAALVAARADADIILTDQLVFENFLALYTPGHSADHFSFLLGDVAFVGDTVLGQGSVFVSPTPGSLSAYLKALETLASYELKVLCPGHGEIINDPKAKLSEYIAHRLLRERQICEAISTGARTDTQIIELVWPDADESLKIACALTLKTHLDKLADEERLSEKIELTLVEG